MNEKYYIIVLSARVLRVYISISVKIEISATECRIRTHVFVAGVWYTNNTSTVPILLYQFIM